MRITSRATVLTGVLLCTALLSTGCGRGSTSQWNAATPPPTAEAAIMDTAGQAAGPAINALGTVRPAQTLLLGFRASGPVRTVSVRLGQDVRAGDLLAELDSTGIEIELQNAQ
jgi:multidrug efflux pump subunit AcrA (membrane-fusion protein)